MDTAPWKDWIPGALSGEQVRALVESGDIDGVRDPDTAIDHSAIDLTLADHGYLMPKGSVKPFGSKYLHDVQKAGLVEELKPDVDGTFHLDACKTYLFPLRETLRFKGHQCPIHGQATAKSSVGRMDVLARLIVEGSSDYDSYGPTDLTHCSMYVEVTPITFNVQVKPGISLSQLRLFMGPPKEAEVRGSLLRDSVLRNADQDSPGALSLGLEGETICGRKSVAFVARSGKRTQKPLPLWKLPEAEKPDPCDYWKLVFPDKQGRLQIREGHFYIMRSRELIAMPKGICVYCRAVDETIGEMRIHYAGFVHPLFGTNRADKHAGTPLIFEVRGHNVNVNLRDGERMARLIFYRMSEDVQPPAHADQGRAKSFYNEQTLQLSKFFRALPEAKDVVVSDDGSLQRRADAPR